MAKTALATTLYFALHSGTASFAAKNAAARAFGTQRSHGWYRAIYSATALGSLFALFFWARRLPDRTLYQARGWKRLLLHLTQAASLAFIVNGVLRLGALRLLGVENLWLHARGQRVNAAPEGQGPPLRTDGQIDDGGAWGWSRNAVNFGVLPIFWAWPRMSLNYAAFCSVTTVYCLLGSVLSERRLAARYGRAWRNYKRKGVSFFVPWKSKKP